MTVNCEYEIPIYSAENRLNRVREMLRFSIQKTTVCENHTFNVSTTDKVVRSEVT